ncbi:DUF3943 domain-containing protein [Marispirochaeta aestuarii]|nr:DUF3943 domain-containing protein [Marispirochaeta aestuarii]
MRLSSSQRVLYSALFFLLFLSVIQLPLSAETGIETEPAETSPRYGMAALEAMGSNLFLLGVNRYIRQAEYAMISPESIHTNLTSSWVWDQDEFSVNQIGHPYQGSFYFISGRSNNLNFWESSLLTLGGSVTWELLMETELPSKNDLIVTSLGGIAVGEMFHRLYLEADASDLHARWLISPMDSMNSLLFREDTKPARGRSSLRDVQLAGGIVLADNELDGSRNYEAAENDFSAYVSGQIIYGDPFILKSITPFEHFEQRFSINLSDTFYSASFFSDGALCAWPLYDTRHSQGSAFISLHYDFIFSSLINLAANSLGLSFKTQHHFGRSWYLSSKLHLNWILLGASEYLHLWYDAPPENGTERRNYDLGTGEGVKFYFEVSHGTIGSILVNYSYYGIHTIPESVPEYGSTGYSIIGILDMAFERRFLGDWYTGVSATSYHKQGFYDAAADTNDIISSVNLYVKRKL